MPWALSLLILGGSVHAQEPRQASAPFQMLRGRVMVQVQLNGQGPFPFLFDTALRTPVLHGAVAEQLGLEPDPANAIEMPAPDGRWVRAVSARLEAISLGGMAWRNTRCLVADLSPLRAQTGAQIAGLIGPHPGWDAFMLDYGQERLVAAEAMPEEVAAGASRVPIERNAADGTLRIPVELDGEHEAQAVLDTGYGGVAAIPRGWARQQGLVTENTPRLTVLAGDSAAMARTQVRLERIEAGGLTIESPVCDVMPAGSQIRLGNGFLQYTRLWISPPDNSAALVPLEGTRIQSPALIGYGITPARVEGGAWVVHVAKLSPADRAGIKPGDKLAAINGRSMRNASYDTVMEALSTSKGARARVEIVRGSTPMQFGLTAGRLL